MDDAITLNYGRHPPKWRRKVLFGLLLIVVLAISADVWYWRGPIAHNMYGWYLQHKCISYRQPPTQIMVETDPISGDTLRSSRPGDYAMFGTITAWRIHSAEELQNKYFGMSGWTGAAIFAHERISRGTRGGNRRLLLVSFDIHTYPKSMDLNTLVIDEGTFFRAPRSMASLGAWLGRDTSGLPDPKPCIFAGQPDPNDPSHFMFDYEEWGQRDTIDGWLEANDEVTYSPRHPPIPP